MKRIVLSGLLIGSLGNLAQAQTIPGATTNVSKPTILGAVRDSATLSGPQTTAGLATDDTDAQLDKAVTALNNGDKAGSTQALQAGITGMEATAQKSSSSFKDKVLAQVSKLKALLPLIAGGSLTGNGLQKAIGLAKLASNAGKLDGLLSAGSLLGKASSLTSGLSGISSGLSALGGSTQSTGQSLITAALGSVSKLDQGGFAAKAAEPVVKNQIGSVLNFVKGAL
ncbi:hypothetical protein CLV58_106291 [Spirosoma oryzae]|uniref:DUF2780 domain-containing protein n=1 Tax=Spirosoma oryzae TaxID=1469603 RepID=A0A2T0T650_9BACT|nr:hypothetical protein [Spirosoma oryzae]PRY41104.1 hypothetical protein CLV58_106291 [Spirosoma oryzae]